MAALGREVLEMVSRKLRSSLEAYRQASHNLSRMLKFSRVRVTPRVLFYLGLRVKWIADNTAASGALMIKGAKMNRWAIDVAPEMS